MILKWPWNELENDLEMSLRWALKWPLNERDERKKYLKTKLNQSEPTYSLLKNMFYCTGINPGTNAQNLSFVQNTMTNGDKNSDK